MKEVFKMVLETFENEDIREFAERFLDTIPQYFYEVGASSTGKYHPKYALGNLGLARHTLALCKIMNHLFSIDCIKEKFNSRERDLMRVAGMAHDTRKSGTQEEYENSKWTKFNHPLLAAEVIRGLDGLPNEEIEIMATAVESHMGQWNKDSRSSVTLPTPKNKYQVLVHVCDYLASRKDIEVAFEDMKIDKREEEVNISNWKIPFGKHKGKTLLEIKEQDPSYIYWAKDNANSEPFRTLVKQL